MKLVWNYLSNPFVVNTIFLVIILYLVYKYIKEEKYNDANSYTPDLIATLGIIGTFFGITIGLLNFDSDPDRMEASVPLLLNGMKTAFITSLIGLGMSSWLKGFQSQKIRVIEKNKKSVEDLLEELIKITRKSSNSNIESVMQELKETTIDSNNKMEKFVSSLENNIKTIFSSGQGSLIEQFKLLREDLISSQKNYQSQMSQVIEGNKSIAVEIAKGNKALIDNFISFREDMAKAFTEEFTQALTKSIEDLNNQLQEQLGENFKNAVNKLVDWQEHYIKTIEISTKLLDTTAHSIQNIDISFNNIADRSETLIKVGEKLEPTIDGLLLKQSELSNGLMSFANVSDEFKEKVQVVVENTIKMSDVIENSSIKTLDLLNNTISGFSNIGEEFSAYTTEIANNFNDKILDFNSSVEETLKTAIERSENHSKLMTSVAQAQVDNMKEVNENLANQYSESIDLVSINLKETFENADKAMIDSIGKIEATMENSLENFAGMLEKVSEKFVDDYLPLTDKLKEILQISNKTMEN